MSIASAWAILAVLILLGIEHGIFYTLTTIIMYTALGLCLNHIEA
jgi:hypothetical protein